MNELSLKHHIKMEFEKHNDKLPRHAQIKIKGQATQPLVEAVYFGYKLAMAESDAAKKQADSAKVVQPEKHPDPVSDTKVVPAPHVETPAAAAKPSQGAAHEA